MSDLIDDLHDLCGFSNVPTMQFVDKQTALFMKRNDKNAEEGETTLRLAVSNNKIIIQLSDWSFISLTQDQAIVFASKLLGLADKIGRPRMNFKEFEQDFQRLGEGA